MKTMQITSRSKSLEGGSTIGIIAVSAPAEESRLQSGMHWLQSQGFSIKVALYPCREYGRKDYMFSSDSPTERARALHELYQDPDVCVILAARGAYGSMEMLPYLDFDLISKHPKPLVGFSDVTALLVSICQKSSQVTIHGPSMETMSRVGRSPEAEKSCRALIGMLCGDGEALTAFEHLTTLCGNETVEGPLLVGNLSTLSSLVGTDYQPNLDGWILGLEEIGEKPYRIHRMLLQMKLAGLFNGLRGLVLGSMTNCEHGSGLGPSWQDVIHDIFDEYRMPVLGGAQFGHASINLPIPLGLKVKVGDNKLEFLDAPVIK